MAKKIKNKTPNQIAYDKQIVRIKKFIKRAEKRGYRFEKGIIPEKPKRITKASIERLKEIKPISLYKKATYLSQEGKVVKGTEGRKEERKIAYLKGILSKNIKKESVWESERRKKDKIIFDKITKSESMRNAINKGNIIYNNILQDITEIERSHKKAANELKKLFEDQIKEFGRDKVMSSISQNESEIKELVDIAMRYNPGDDRHDTAIRELYTSIKGEIPSSQDFKRLQDAIDEDVSFDGSYT